MRNPAAAAGFGTAAATAWLSLGLFVSVSLSGVRSMRDALEASEGLLGCSFLLLLLVGPVFYALGLPIPIVLLGRAERGLSRRAVVLWGAAAGAVLGVGYPALLGAFLAADRAASLLKSARSTAVAASTGAVFGLASAWYVVRPEKRP